MSASVNWGGGAGEGGGAPSGAACRRPAAAGLICRLLQPGSVLSRRRLHAELEAFSIQQQRAVQRWVAGGVPCDAGPAAVHPL